MIDRLAHDRRLAFAEMKGFSLRNLKYRRAFAEVWPDGDFVQDAAAQLPWFHPCTLPDKLKTREAREWYAAAALAHGRSRNVLAVQIETRLQQRQGAAATKFSARLPAQSDRAHATLKEPYRFDFLGLAADAQERDIERALVQHGTKFLLKLGGEAFYIDQLCYHLTLRCYLVVALKAGRFKPEYAGQRNFSLSAIDADVNAPEAQPTVGLLLRKEQNRTVAAYALRGVDKPMGIAAYQLVRAIPDRLATQLPTIEQIEAELQQDRAAGATREARA